MATRTYPTGHQTSPHGNTSDDATRTSLLDTVGLSKELFEEFVSYITDVLSGFDSDPDVIMVEVEGPDLKLETNIHPDGLRTMSDGRRIYVHPSQPTEDFILRFTTSDVLETAKLYVQDGNVALLVFAGKRYGLLPLMKLKVNSTIQ
jgi:hypothetical protein